MNHSCHRSVILLCGVFAISLSNNSSADGSSTVLAQAKTASKASIVLTPFVVSSKPIGSFGLSVKAIRGGFSADVAELTILDVIPHTDAEKQGLGPLTQILSIDGRSVNEFAASFDKGTELNLKLVDRKRGDRITMEVLIRGAGKPKQVTLTEGHGVHQFPIDSDSEIEPLRTVHIGISH
jgi:C-terminal processing protease CtpA/Prc